MSNVSFMLPQHNVMFVTSQCALWGFRGGMEDWGNPYRAVMVDSMHQGELGLWVHLVACMRENYTRKQLREMDQILKDLAGETRISTLRLPGGTYFEKGATYMAFEHRGVMQVMFQKYCCNIPDEKTLRNRHM